MDVLGDGISNVSLLDYMGTDLSVVNAARVSYSKTSHWVSEMERLPIPGPAEYREREKHLSEADAKLLHYLATHNHWTPFSHPQIQFRIKMPLFIAREWYRHTVGFTRNEVSRRYVNTKPEFYTPSEIRNKPEQGQSKQGSHGLHYDSPIISESMNVIMNLLIQDYEKMINSGVAPEQARIILPLGTYTEFWETASLYAYSRLCKLRIQTDAQLETRKYAEAVSSIIEPLFPVSWKALQE